jgi:hypothetical protein
LSSRPGDLTQAPIVDPQRQSAIVGAVLGLGVAVIGVVVVSVALGAIETRIHAPREIVGLAGVGLVLCGGAFAVVTLHRGLALCLAAPGALLAFILPIGWFLLTRA